jgi:molybdopterin-guanine dinucleotide biosynthesis protein A
VDLAAVILAGGTGVRLGGADKASIELGGRTLLEHALDATRTAHEVVVVGAQVPTSRPATFVREDPPLGGPVAGLVAGRAVLARPAEAIVVLAVDMPCVTAATVDRLVAAVAERDGAVLCDGEGRPQLVAVLRLAALDAAAPPDPHGASVRSLLAPMALVPVPAQGREAHGVDTWEDLRDLPD